MQSAGASAVSVLDWRLIVSVGIPAMIAVAALVAGHLFTAHRELVARRRQARVDALERAFVRLAMLARRPWPPDADQRRAFEEMVPHLQLYATPDQVAELGRIITGLSAPGTVVSFDALLHNLRDDLRKELSLAPMSLPVWWYRFELGAEGTNELAPPPK